MFLTLQRSKYLFLIKLLTSRVTLKKIMQKTVIKSKYAEFLGINILNSVCEQREQWMIGSPKICFLKITTKIYWYTIYMVFLSPID